MKINYYIYTIMTLIAGVLGSCVGDLGDADSPTRIPRKLLSVEEARNYYETRTVESATRAAAETPGLFTLGEIVPDWTQAEVSATDRISCVDFPARMKYDYYFTRNDAQGEAYTVRGWAEMTVVKNLVSEEVETYVHFYIPDKEYASLYDCDISELFANCEDRGDYCGLELYTTLEGRAVALARYDQGRTVADVYAYEQRRTSTERFWLFLKIMGDMQVTRKEAAETRGGSGGQTALEWFVDSKGGCYVTIDLNDDGVADAVTQWEAWIDMRDAGDMFKGCFRNSTGGSGGHGGLIGGNSGDSGGGSGSGSGDGSGSGSGDGGSPGGSAPGGGSGGGSGSGGIISPDLPYIHPGYIPGSGSSGNPDVPVASWDKGTPVPWPSDIIVIPLTSVFPCFDDVNGEANPLMNMKISDDNRSWKSNTWGYVRQDKFGNPRFHDGVDIAGEEGVTPVFAMYSGEVTNVITYQPKRLKNGMYPRNYYGKDKNAAGNRITIKTTLPDGRVIYVSYWHLDIESKNPYTKVFGIGDRVEKGQKIGVVGRTGNAFDMKPHLHLKTYIEGTNAKTDNQNDPRRYLYTKFDDLNGKVTRDC